MSNVCSEENIYVNSSPVATVVWPVSSDGSGPVSLRLGNLKLTVTAVVDSSLAPKSGVDVHDALGLLNPGLYHLFKDNDAIKF